MAKKTNYNKKQYSLIKRMTISLIVIYLALFSLMLFNDAFVINNVRQRVYDQLHDVLIQETNQITSELNDVTTFLISVSLNSPSLNIVQQDKKDTEYYSSIYKLKLEFQNALTSMPIVKGIFVFTKNNESFIYSTTEDTTASHVRSWFRNNYQNENFEDNMSTHWFPIENEGKYYLMRFLKVGDSYIGTWTNFSEILKQIENTQSIDWIPLFYSNENNIYNIKSQKSDIEYTIKDDGTISFGPEFFTISHDVSRHLQGTIYLLVSTGQIYNQLKIIYLITLILGTLFVGFAIISIYFIHKSIISPINQLENSLTALRSGDFSARIPSNNSCKEFIDVNNAFNQMVEKIEDLKINVYEEHLLQQKTEMLFLKSQVAPHFLINCLNAIYHLTANGDYKNTLTMAVCLGDHLRYALADVTTVTFKEELDKVINYTELSKLRFPDSIKLNLDYDTNLDNTVALPMIILFQVENIIKYEVVYGEITEINITAKIIEDNCKKRTFIEIYDSGQGYREEILEQLKSEEMLSQGDGNNIGTKNIVRRLRLVFGEDFNINFSNKENFGALVQIDIPFVYHNDFKGAEKIEHINSRR